MQVPAAPAYSDFNFYKQPLTTLAACGYKRSDTVAIVLASIIGGFAILGEFFPGGPFVHQYSS